MGSSGTTTTSTALHCMEIDKCAFRPCLWLNSQIKRHAVDKHYLLNAPPFRPTLKLPPLTGRILTHPFQPALKLQPWTGRILTPRLSQH